MAKFKVGDRVAAVYSCSPFYSAGNVGTVVGVFANDYDVDFDKVPSVRIKHDGSSHWFVTHVVAEQARPAGRRTEAHKEEYRAAARATDPATSKGQRKVNKYEQVVLDYLTKHGEEGGTGKSIAESTFTPLNCITPRFAPLRRKGLIKDSGAKHDKQTVWVLA